MSYKRIQAILLQEFYITKGSLEVIMDLPFFSIMSVFVFGFVTTFLSNTTHSPQASYIILGIILWEIIRVTQYSMSVEVLWNVWSKNLSNMFVTPLSIGEYFLAQMISATIKSLLIFFTVSLIALFVFHFNIFVVGWENLILFFINLLIFAFATGIFILGFIFRYGTRIQSLAWGLIFLFQPLTAAFFPVKFLPPSLQTLAYLIPPTYVFEAARQSLIGSSINWSFMIKAFLLNMIYFGLSLFLFHKLFQKSKDTGQFARIEG